MGDDLMKYLIHDSTIVTGNLTREILYQASILVEDGIIKDIGKTNVLQRNHPDIAKILSLIHI